MGNEGRSWHGTLMAAALKPAGGPILGEGVRQAGTCRDPRTGRPGSSADRPGMRLRRALPAAGRRKSPFLPPPAPPRRRFPPASGLPVPCASNQLAVPDGQCRQAPLRGRSRESAAEQPAPRSPAGRGVAAGKPRPRWSALFPPPPAIQAPPAPAYAAGRSALSSSLPPSEMVAPALRTAEPGTLPLARGGRARMERSVPGETIGAGRGAPRESCCGADAAPWLRVPSWCCC